MPHIIVFICGFKSLMQDFQEELEALRSYISDSGEKTGIHIIAVAQEPGPEIMTADVQKCFTARLSFSMSDESTASAVGLPDAIKLKKPGERLFKASTSEEAVYLV